MTEQNQYEGKQDLIALIDRLRNKPFELPGRDIDSDFRERIQSGIKSEIFGHIDALIADNQVEVKNESEDRSYSGGGRGFYTIETSIYTGSGFEVSDTTRTEKVKWNDRIESEDRPLTEQIITLYDAAGNTTERCVTWNRGIANWERFQYDKDSRLERYAAVKENLLLSTVTRASTRVTQVDYKDGVVTESKYLEAFPDYEATEEDRRSYNGRRSERGQTSIKLIRQANIPEKYVIVEYSTHAPGFDFKDIHIRSDPNLDDADARIESIGLSETQPSKQSRYTLPTRGDLQGYMDALWRGHSIGDFTIDGEEYPYYYGLHNFPTDEDGRIQNLEKLNLFYPAWKDRDMGEASVDMYKTGSYLTKVGKNSVEVQFPEGIKVQFPLDIDVNNEFRKNLADYMLDFKS